MSWKSISGNQTVSRANLQDAIDNGVFVARSGVPGSESNRDVTKLNAQDYIYSWEIYPSFRSKSLTQLPVKSNLAVQSNQIYASGQSIVYLGNNNRDWIIPILYASGDTWGSAASSVDNRCILVGKSYTSGSGGGSAWVSNDYGETFTRLDSIMTTNDAAMSAAMNSYGDYMIVTRQRGSFGSQRAYIYWSYNSGANWATGYHDTVDYNFNGAAMSGVGVYATVLGSDGTSYYVWTSTSFGSSFTKTYLCSGSKVVRGGCVAMSKSGQYQLLTPPQASGSDIGNFYLSNNYGASWTAINLTPVPLAPNDVFFGCSVSAGGDYMTVSSYSSSLGAYRTYISNDWGANWTATSGADVGQAVDSSGQFQYQNFRKSIDYGNTWTSGMNAQAISINPTTYTTPYIYGTSTGGDLYKSVNQGSSFSATSLLPYITKVATSGGSNNGKFVAAIKDNGSYNYTLYKSSDYGNSWSTNFSTSGEIMLCCSVSDNGVYWIVVTYNSGTNTSYVYRSTDSGASWSYTYYSTTGQIQKCAMSNDGKNMVAIVNYPSGGYSAFVIKSSDYGASWQYGNLFNSLGRIYNDVAMSGGGKFAVLVATDSGNSGCRTFYSDNYGVDWSEKYYNAGFYATSCAMDDTGRVCLAANVANDNSYSQIYHTTDGWSYYTSNSPSVPVPSSPPVITGVNISSDGTYWSAVSNNTGYSFVCSAGNGVFAYQNAGITFNGLSK